MVIEDNFDLTNYNSFGISARCKHFCSISNESELKDLLQNSQFNNLPKLPLGGGSNLLLTQNYNGLVIKIDIKGIEKN